MVTDRQAKLAVDPTAVPQGLHVENILRRGAEAGLHQETRRSVGVAVVVRQCGRCWRRSKSSRSIDEREVSAYLTSGVIDCVDVNVRFSFTHNLKKVGGGKRPDRSEVPNI